MEGIFPNIVSHGDDSYGDWNHVIAADAPRWQWIVEGTEYHPHSTMVREFFDTGIIRAEGPGEALDWLINHGPIWDGGLDPEVEDGFTITIRPIADDENDIDSPPSSEGEAE